MPNPCEGCPLNCCVDFTISSPPDEVDQTLIEFPFIHRTDRRRIPSSGRKGFKVIDIYNCTRFDAVNNVCLRRDTEAIPSFCQRTGNIAKPHSRCLLDPSS